MDPYRASMMDVPEVYRKGDLLVCGYCRAVAEAAAASCDQQPCDLPEPICDYSGPVRSCQDPHCGRDFDTLEK